MNPSEIAFLATVATIIPVFLVAYAVGVRTLMEETLGQRYFDSFGDYLRKVGQAARGEKSLLSALASMLLSTFFQTVIFAVFVVAAGLPALAEFEALYGLYSGETSSSSKTLCMVGAMTAAAIVVAPLAYTMLKVQFPFSGFLEFARKQRSDNETSVVEDASVPDEGSDAESDP